MTNIGQALAARGKPSGWGGYYFGSQDDGHGSVRPEEAQLLYALVRAMKPELVLEVGTSYGYSGLHLAAALQDNHNGHLWTVETNDVRRDEAGRNFAEAGLTDWITQEADLAQLPMGRWDMVFLDAGHTVNAVRSYLDAVRNAYCVIVHDAAHQNHVLGAIEGTDWRMVLLPLGYCGWAFLQRAEMKCK